MNPIKAWATIPVIAVFVSFLFLNDGCGDLIHYYVFAEAFPILYRNDIFGFYSVVYLPQFYFYIVWFYKTLDVRAAYLLFTVINLVCVIDLFRLCARLPRPYFVVACVCVFFASTSLGKWANVESVVTYVMILHYLRARETHSVSTLDAIVVAFFSFKIYSLIVLPLVLCELKREDWMRYVATVGFWLLVLNLPFYVLNPETYTLAFVQQVLAGGPEVIQKVWLMRYRPSFTIVVAFGTIKCYEMKGKF